MEHNERWSKIIEEYVENNQDKTPAFQDVLTCIGNMDNLSPDENPRRISLQDILENCDAVDGDGLETYLQLLTRAGCISVHEDQFGRYVVITPDGQGISMVLQIVDRFRSRLRGNLDK